MKNQKLNFILAIVISTMCFSCEDEDPEAPNTAPVALFTALPSSATVGDEIIFNDQSGDEDGEIVKWSWDFGDGETSNEQNPTHTYEQSGDYIVNLWVFDNQEDSASFSLDVTISSFAELWVETIGTASIAPSAPAVGADGTLYFGSQDFNVYAIDPSNGSTRWSFTTGGKVRSRPSIGADGTIYIPAQDNKLYALNTLGSKLWDFEFPASIFNASPAIGSDGTIYQGSDDDKLYAINPDGTEKWSFMTEGNIRTDAAIAADGTIYIASSDAKLYALTPNGTEKWDFETSAQILASPCLGADGTIYVGDDGGKFYAINPNGTQKWLFTAFDDSPFLGGPVLDTDGTIYIGTKRGPTTDIGTFYAIDENGSEKWKYDMPKGDDVSGSAQNFQNDILGTPTVGANGTVYITFNDGNLYAFNTTDGSVKFTYKVATDEASEHWDQAMWTSPALTDEGNIYFQDYSGNVYALQVSAAGLANSPWPTRGKNLSRTSF